MTGILKKFKSFFTTPPLTTASEETPVPQETKVVCEYLKVNQDPSVEWHTLNKIGNGAFGEIFKVVFGGSKATF